MPNHLADSSSPYLLQHADNPVEWFPWGEKALAQARKDDKPIFLSIGYAACHWCHVMAHESFADEATAVIMNEHFINIKVDREERPDIDNIYMSAVVALTGSGGWPMSVFLTPDGRPFYGGTYFPPVPRYNIPSFRDVLLGIARAWKDDREEILQSAEKVTQNLKVTPELPRGEQTLDPKLLDRAAMALAQSYDWDHGGWGKAPKFPQPMAIEFLLRKATQGDKFALEIACHALRAMAQGGMYDVLGGGFARYSTDDDWRIPHFEKMLYDNAQLASVYLHSYLITKDVYFRSICEETLEFVIREMTNQEGGFYSSLDADSGGGEGLFYLWTYEELKSALPEAEDFDFVELAYGIQQNGAHEGRNILRKNIDAKLTSERLKISLEEYSTRLSRVNNFLFQARERRARPGVDDKVLVSWNALMSVVFSEAGRYLNNKLYIDMAIRNTRFVLDKMYSDKHLCRSWRSNNISQFAFLEDYAALILALTSVYQSDPDPFWYATADNLVGSMIAHFQDPAGGFYDSSDEHEKLILRPKELQDNALPSGNALAATVLYILTAYAGHEEYREFADSMLNAIKEVAVRYPLGFSQWLCAVDFAIHPSTEVAIIGPVVHAGTQELIRALWSDYRPNLVAAISDLPLSPLSPALLQNKGMVNDLPTAYLCHSFYCKQPVNKATELLQLLEESTGMESNQD